jgi:hypothetical protein
MAGTALGLALLESDWMPPVGEAFQIQLTANVAEFPT